MQTWQQRLVRVSASFAALSLAAATALSAYAAHGLAAEDHPRAYSAVAMLAVHGLGLLIVSRFGTGLLLTLVRVGILLGLSLFCGSLLAALFWKWRPLLAPFGGSLLILSWLMAAPAVWRGNAAEGR